MAHKKLSKKIAKTTKIAKIAKIAKRKYKKRIKDPEITSSFSDLKIGDIVDIVDIIPIVPEDVELDIDDNSEEDIVKVKKSAIEDILFKLPIVKDPIIGSPKQAQDKLDKMAKSIQKNPKSERSQKLFNKIHLYMHGYLINMVLRQFPYIKGMQTSDIYQQTLIALWTKAIPGFKDDKGMSFLNFAKMCIRRHLITVLNTSKTRQKDQSINRAISLDSSPLNVDEDSHNTFSNIIPDKEDSVDKKTANEEAYAVTKNTLFNILSDFEKTVLTEYLSTSTYKEIATNISKDKKSRCLPKSVDNALLRIRKKALSLRRYGKIEEIPLFIV